MIDIIYEPDEEYESFVSAHSKGHLFQSKYWKDVKCNWHWCAIVSKSLKGEIQGTMAVLIRKVPFTPFSLMYAPRGPVCDKDDVKTIVELTYAAKMLGKEKRAYVLKIDPDIDYDDISFRTVMQEIGYKLLPSAEGFQNIQAQNVIRLNIGGLTKEQVFAGFKQKTRYNIRLAARRGVGIRECGYEAIEDFSQLMQETGERDNFGVRNSAYFVNMLRALGSHGALFMAYYDNKPIAGTMFAYYGDKAWYLYGASSNSYRNVMPNYLLQWTMIQRAMDLGCRIYDFRGVTIGKNGEDGGGLLKFKSGWGGELKTFVGEFEYEYMPIINMMMKKLIPFGKKLIMAGQRKGRAGKEQLPQIHCKKAVSIR